MSTYRLLDSGDGRRLEQVGPYRLVRQAASAWWSPRSRWDHVDAVHVRDASGGGHWEYKSKLPEEWEIEHGGVRMLVRPTPFGHLGVFAEHVAQWEWMAARIAGQPLKVLNLFSDTGGASLACARAGAEVTHVDAAKGVVDWARRNAQLNGLDSIRWVVEDAALFVASAKTSGRTYDGVVLDPPTFGRGAKKELWKVEEHLAPLLRELKDLVPSPRFFVLSCHTPGFTGLALANLLEDCLGPGASEHGEMWIPGADGRSLPSGSFARR